MEPNLQESEEIQTKDQAAVVEVLHRWSQTREQIGLAMQCHPSCVFHFSGRIAQHPSGCFFFVSSVLSFGVGLYTSKAEVAIVETQENPPMIAVRAGDLVLTFLPSKQGVLDALKNFSEATKSAQ